MPDTQRCLETINANKAQKTVATQEVGSVIFNGDVDSLLYALVGEEDLVLA